MTTDNSLIPVEQWFIEKYCDECKIGHVCGKIFNPNCLRTMAEHNKAVFEVSKALGSQP